MQCPLTHPTFPPQALASDCDLQPCYLIGPRWSLGFRTLPPKLPPHSTPTSLGTPEAWGPKSPLEGLSRAKTEPLGPVPFFCLPFCPGPDVRTGPRSAEDGGSGPNPGQRREWGWARMAKEGGSVTWIQCLGEHPPSSCPQPSHLPSLTVFYFSFFNDKVLKIQIKILICLLRVQILSHLKLKGHKC